jgi:4-amino-4-deoxy-L-arabinose transferase-like glycosyltransferase
MTKDFSDVEKNTLRLLIAGCIFTYLISWQIPLMEIDAVQYANISREMLQHRNFFQVYDQGLDYLDKPPMLFWLSSVSMWIFGIHDAAYRLPSFLFSLLSIYSTYCFARLYYTERTALLSALVLAGSQALFLINHDVRTDTMLMGWVIFSIWKLASWLQNRNWQPLLLSAAGIAGGMMTKGPVALMVPVFAFSVHFILSRSFKLFFLREYLFILMVIAVLLIPMSVGLYRQYDLHPEKIMDGHQGVSGLRFFYWTQSFGRITGASSWHENKSFFFLFENLLWGFLPWTILFVLGLITGIREWLRNKFFIRPGEEAISLGGFLITYCALATSNYQLPHYIYVVLPLASVITGKFLDAFIFGGGYIRWLKPLTVIHYIIFSLLVIALFLLITLPFPPQSLIITISALLMTLLFIVALVRHWIPIPSLLSACVLTIILINIWVDTGFYPKLLEYQMSIPVSRFINRNHLNKDRIFLYQMSPYRSLDFYCNHTFHITSHPDSLRAMDYILTTQKGMEMINSSNYKIIDSGLAFRVSMLSMHVLNPATRRANSEPYYLLEHNR